MEKSSRSHNFIDLTSEKFGRLKPSKVVSTGVVTKWECLCDCGNVTVKRAQHLTLGLSKSCGCLRKEVAKENMRAMSFKHGMSVAHKSLYSIWSGMMSRCYNKNNAAYKRYGGRGITVSCEWHDAAQFIADMSPRPPRMTIDRIDNDKGYSKENCRWATCKEQNNNRKSTKLVEFNGVIDSIANHASKFGKKKSLVYDRLKLGWSLEDALTKPTLFK